MATLQQQHAPLARLLLQLGGSGARRGRGGGGSLLLQQLEQQATTNTTTSMQQLLQQAALAAGRRGLASSTSAEAAAAAARSSAGSGSSSKSPLRQLKAWVRDYKQLSKFRLSSLVALTASAGFAAGSGDSIDYAKLAWTTLGTLGAAACANSLNQLYEVVNDGRMARTANRPLPAGRLSTRQAAVFALLSGAAGLWLLAEQTNELTFALGAANIALYAGVYTPLKQLSVANTWVGAVVGAIPPLMGWAAAAGQLDPGAWVLAAALFSWQMPHFLALAWLCKDDYARGGFRMLPSIDPTGRRTAAVALRHTALLLPLGLVAAAMQVTSQWFAGEAALLAAAMGAGALAFRAHPSPEGARKLFRGSLLYLPLLLAGMVAHRQPNTQPVTWQALSERVLPDALQPGAVWATLQGLHWPRLRPLEERYAMLLEVQRQMQSVRCPSRAYGDSSSSGSVEEGEGDEQQLQALEGSDNGQAEAGDGGSRNSSSSSSRREAAAQ